MILGIYKELCRFAWGMSTTNKQVPVLSAHVPTRAATTNKRLVPVLSAHVPTGALFDERQVAYFESPEELEEDFRYTRGSALISRHYVQRQLNPMLSRMRATLVGGVIRDEITVFKECCDVVDLVVQLRWVGNDLRGRHQFHMELPYITVRPCFWGQSMLTIIVYQLLYLALLRRDVRKIVISKCVPTTSRILFRKFGPWVTYKQNDDEQEGELEFEFADLGRVAAEVSAERLGIAQKLASEDLGRVVLRKDGFPTAEQLNDAEWVEKKI